jgi:ribosomal protein S18 acetylase RimI-like enzyme
MALHTLHVGFLFGLEEVPDEESMEDVIIRPVSLADLKLLTEIDHSYHTDYVWQMELDSRQSEVNVCFREVRLPRSMRVEYPRDISYLVEGWQEREGLLVAEYNGESIGYINLTAGNNSNLINILDLVVTRRYRRQGVGISLIQAAQTWAIQENAAYLMLGMQSKNYPAICLVNMLGFEFCGYNDHYFANQDIAIFFTQRL